MTHRQLSNARTCPIEAAPQRTLLPHGRILRLLPACHARRRQPIPAPSGLRGPHPLRALLKAAPTPPTAHPPASTSAATATAATSSQTPKPAKPPSLGTDHGADVRPAASLPRLLHSFIASLAAGSLLAASSSGVGLLASVGPAAARPRLTPDEQLTIEIFKQSTPSVVNVTNLAIKRDAFTMNMLEMPQGQGSGFVWDYAGHVVTNYHVIQDASDIRVTLADGEEFSAKVVGVDQDKDIAVLQIGPLGPGGELMAAAAAPLPPMATASAAASSSGGGGGGGSGVAGVVVAEAIRTPPPASVRVEPLSLCSSSADIVVGQKVFAIGNPFGLDHTLTVGVVSGTGREIQSISGRPIQDVIQTDAAINPGNSGGPLLDSGGCLIGINTAIYSPTGANNGVGFAIPVDIVKSSVGQIIQYGKVTRPMLGISFAPDVSSEALGIKGGILVLSAREGGPAFKAGLKGSTRDEYGRLVLGDIITAVNGIKIKTSSDLYRVLDKAQVGDALRITVLRENSTFDVDVVLEPNSPWPAGPPPPPFQQQQQP